MSWMMIATMIAMMIEMMIEMMMTGLNFENVAMVTSLLRRGGAESLWLLIQNSKGKC